MTTVTTRRGLLIVLATGLAGMAAVLLAPRAEAVVVDPPPKPLGVVSATPACSPVGPTSLTVTGSGLPTDYEVEIRLDGVVVAPASPVGPTTTWSRSFAVSLTEGVHVVSTRVTTREPATTYDAASTSIQVPCPSLEAAPARFAQRTGTMALSVVARGFEPGASVRLRVGTTALGPPVAVGASGRAETTVDFPADLACGPQTLLVTEVPAPIEAVAAPRSAETVVTVTCPTLAVEPDRWDVGAAPPSTRWAVTGLDPSAPLTLLLDGGVVGLGRTDRTGAATVTIPLPARGCGVHEAVATTPLQEATAQPRAVSSVTVDCAPQLSATPTRLARRDGTAAVQLQARGFTPGAELDLGTAGGPALSTLLVDADGTAESRVQIPLAVGCGRLELRAVEREAVPARSATTAVQVTCPSLAVSPDRVAPGALPLDSTWDLAGFDPDEEVTLSLDGEPAATLRTDAGGGLRTTMPLVAPTCGEHTAQARQGGPAGPTASATVTVTCSTSVAVEPVRIADRPGPLPVTLRGSDFDRRSPVVVELDGVPFPGEVPALAGSTLEVRLALPESTPCGPHLLTVRQEGGRSAQASVEVTCPVLIPLPRVLPEDTTGSPVRWLVSGFDPASRVVVAVSGRPVGALDTDSTGSGSLLAPLGRLGCGPLAAEAVQVVEGSAPRVGADLLVVCEEEVEEGPSVPDPIDPPVAQPELASSPAVVRGGEAVRATGRGFRPGGRVRLTWTLPDGTAATGGTTAVVSPDGTFSASCLVLSHAPLGGRELVAMEVRAGGLGASAPVLVVAGSGQPGRHGLVSRR